MQILTYYERQRIEYYSRLKLSTRAIARKLKRDHSVIGRELRRNTRPGKRYSAQEAQRLADLKAKKTNKRKLEKDYFLHDFVISRLKDGWSPEQIAGRLKNNPPRELQGISVSHEAIYQYIYEGEGRFEHLYPLLRRKQSKRRKKLSRKHHKTRILERISIHQRNPEINERKRFGDWESDTVEFRRRKQEKLSVQYERKARLVRMHRVLNKTAEETEHALRKTIESLPQELFQTITFDNGTEGANHRVIRDEYGLATFFCDSYASWQKGGVENANGLIREYLPLDTDLSGYTDYEIYTIQERLNNRPRKVLGYKTPNEVINDYYLTGGALNC